MRRKLFVSLACALALFIVLLTGVGNAAKPKQSQYQRGLSIYMANCEACHMMGTNVIKPEKELTKSDKIVSEKVFREFLSEKHGLMPAFRDLVKDEETCGDLYRFVKKLKNQTWDYEPEAEKQEKP